MSDVELSGLRVRDVSDVAAARASQPNCVYEKPRVLPSGEKVVDVYFHTNRSGALPTPPSHVLKELIEDVTVEEFNPVVEASAPVSGGGEED